MKKIITKFLIPIFLTFTSLTFASAQNNESQRKRSWEKFIHIETGCIYPEGTIKEDLSIRQNISYYYADQYSIGNISSSMNGWFFGIRYEHHFSGLKSGISTGLRFTGLNTEISGYTSYNSEFFYLRYSMQGSDTKFARVKSLTEDDYQLSIPFEIKHIPLRYKNLSIFVKLGYEQSIISFRKRADINFQEGHMKVHKNEILERITNPVNKYCSLLYGAVGLQHGKTEKLKYSFEVLLPSLFLTKNNFYLVDAGYFEGFRFSIQFPLKNNK